MNTANVALAEQARQALLAVISEADLPVGLRIRSGDMLLIEGGDAGILTTSIVSHENGDVKRFDPLKIPLSTLVQVIEEGVRRHELKNRLGPNPSDSRMADYHELKSALQHADMGRHSEIIERHKLKTQNDPGILGKIFTEPAADGYAYYMVTQERPGQVRLNSLPVHDGYVSHQLGADAWIDPERVRTTIETEPVPGGRRSNRRGP